MMRGPRSRAGLIANPIDELLKKTRQRQEQHACLHSECYGNTKYSNKQDQWNEITWCGATAPSLIRDREHN